MKNLFVTIYIYLQHSKCHIINIIIFYNLINLLFSYFYYFYFVFRIFPFVCLSFSKSLTSSSSSTLQLFVNQMKTKPLSGPLHPGKEVGNLLASLHLFLQELSLQKVGELSVIVVRGDLMHVQQGLVNSLLQLKRSFNSLKSSSPFVSVRSGDVPEYYFATSHSLVVDEFVGMFSLLLARLFEPLGESWKSDVIPTKVGSH